MTTLLTIAAVFALVIIGAACAAIGKAINGDWPEPGE